jgi:hypothetical protein
MEPPPPTRRTTAEPARPRLVAPEAWRPPPAGIPRLQRGALLLGGFALAALGFARAPYLALAVLALSALAVRTVSWTTESARERRHRRGRRRWYDGLLTLASSPWYLVVATAGTVVLAGWAAAVAFVVGLAYLLFGLPLVPGLLLMGATLAVSLWWGPGARRVRLPVRRLVLVTTGRAWLGWLGVALVVAAAGLCALSLLTDGVTWEPLPGPPWRHGTLLGDLVRWL